MEHALPSQVEALAVESGEADAAVLLAEGAAAPAGTLPPLDGGLALIRSLNGGKDGGLVHVSDECSQNPCHNC